MGDGAIAIFVGASLATRSNDTEYPFRQDSDFWYLTGFDHPNAVAVLRTDGGPAYTLYVEPRDRERRNMDGLPAGHRWRVRRLRGRRGHPESARFMRDLPELVGKARRIYHLCSAAASRSIAASIGHVSKRCAAARGRAMRRPTRSSTRAASSTRCACSKSPAEVELMRRAAAISAEGAHRGGRTRPPRALRVRARSRARVSLPPPRGRAARPTPPSSAAARNATILHYITQRPRTRGGRRARAHRRRQCEYARTTRPT